MAYENTNRGALFKSTRKKADTDCDYRGEVDINGQPYWLKTSKAGEKYMSLSVRPKEAKELAKPRSYASRRDDIDMLS